VRRLHNFSVVIAILALAMRALVPVGWMPSATASNSSLVPCPMMDGMGLMAKPQQRTHAQHPAKHQLPASHEGSICPFATAAQAVRTIHPQQIEVAPARFAFAAPATLVVKAAWDHVPRAPPALG